MRRVLRLSDTQKRFLLSGIENNRRVFRSSVKLVGSSYWEAGSAERDIVKLLDKSGMTLLDEELIERLYETGTRNPKAWDGGYEYRITDRGTVLATS